MCSEQDQCGNDGGGLVALMELSRIMYSENASVPRRNSAVTTLNRSQLIKGGDRSGAWCSA